MSLDAAKGIFEVKGKQFELYSLTMGSHQSVDESNRPNATAKFVNATVVVRSNENSPIIFEWAHHHNQKNDCTVTTRIPEEDQSDNQIEWKQAFCVGHTLMFNHESTMLLQFVLTAEKTTINGFEVDQRWQGKA